MLFWGLLRKMAPIYTRTDELWLHPLSLYYMLAAVIRPQSLPSAVLRIIG